MFILQKRVSLAITVRIAFATDSTHPKLGTSKIVMILVFGSCFLGIGVFPANAEIPGKKSPRKKHQGKNHQGDHKDHREKPKEISL